MLIKIQAELKAPKNQYNSFGKYKYRNCEDILEAVKPLLLKYDAQLFINDTIELIGERYYVKATATIIFSDGKTFTTTAFAREEENKKGMDGAQVTGAASSYARKYALNGLFLIDDTKDADAQEPKKEPLSDERFAVAIEKLKAGSVKIESITKFDLTESQRLVINNYLENKQ